MRDPLLHTEFSNHPVHIHLPTPALQTPSIALDATGSRLYVMLVTTTGLFVKIAFAAPNFFNEDDPRSKTTRTYQIAALLPSRIEGKTNKPVLVQFPNPDSVLVGCSNGTIVKLVHGHTDVEEDEDFCVGSLSQNSGYQETELTDGTYIDQIKSALTPARVKQWFSPFKGQTTAMTQDSTESPRQPVAMNSVRDFSFTLGRDRQVRIVNLKTQSRWKTINVPLDFGRYTSDGNSDVSPSSQSPLIEATTGHFIQIFDERAYDIGDDFDESGFQFKCAIYLPSTPGDHSGFFAIYKGRMDRHEQLQEFDFLGYEDSAPNGDRLIDFLVLPYGVEGREPGWMIWGLWQNANGSLVKYADVREEGVEEGVESESTRWTVLPSATLPDSAPVTDAPPGTSVCDHYLDFVAYPGRFSDSTREAALVQFEEATGGVFRDSMETDSPEKASTWQDQTIAAIDAASEAAGTDEATEWGNFIRTCFARHAFENAPAAIDWDPIFGSILITKRGCLSAVREHDVLEVSDSEDLSTRPSVFALSDSPAPADDRDTTSDSFRGAYATFSSLVAWLNMRLPEENPAAIEHQIKTALPGSTHEEFIPFLVSLGQDTFGTFATDDPSAAREFATQYARIDASFFSTLITALTTSKEIETLDPLQAPNASRFTCALLVEGFVQTVTERGHLMRSALVVLLFAAYIAESIQDESITVDQTLLLEASLGLHSYIIGKWIAAKRLETHPTSTEEDTADEDAGTGRHDHRLPSALTGRMKGLTLGITDEQVASSTPTNSTEPLALHLLSQHFLPEVDFGSHREGGYGRLLRLGVEGFIGRLGFLHHFKGQNFRPSAPLLQVVNKLLGFHHVTAASELVDLLPQSPAVFYLKGRVAVEAGDFVAAEGCFNEAAVEFGMGELTPGTLLSDILPRSVTEGGALAYYQHLMQLFARKKNDRAVVKYSLQALLTLEQSPETPETRRLSARLWNENFRHCLSIEDFEGAHTAVISNPDKQIRLNCLRLLVGRMCETGHIDGLCGKFSFDGLQEELELELVNKIRTTNIEDCLTNHGPNYHRVYFSYSVSRNDYRTAASAMYMYAQRIDLASRAPGSKLRSMDALREQCAGYLASINALRSVDPENAWLLVSSERTSRKRRRLDRVDSDSSSVRSSRHDSADVRAIRVTHIQREYALGLAKLKLYATPAAQNSEGLPTPSDALAMYVAANRYDDALSLGLQLGLDLTKVYESMAEKCVWLSKRSADAR
ncbi:hypothetical protein HKX48_005683 [Thoreauomyces humboldtii]|nr:hypothetical protein HKX48_005683 [Thoreauomyces humboldtii]